ncbi:MAG TPA: FkbM family methyltransferase [Gemmatimonadaceae bacterium]
MRLRALAGRLRRWISGVHTTPGDDYYRVSFSQEGEDLLLLWFFEWKPSGFYVDVGAHHPRKYSNTLAFYSRGWSGINIDAMPGSMKPFQEARPRDVNLELAISDARRVLTFYEFNEPALNGFDPDTVRSRDGFVPAGGSSNAVFWVVSERQIETVTLAEVLDAHLPAGRDIDFMNVDVEGLDYAVLASNNWDKYRPTIVLAEDPGVVSLDDLGNSRIVRFLRERGYVPLCKTRLTLFFVRQDRLANNAFGPGLLRVGAGQPDGDQGSGRQPTT